MEKRDVIVVGNNLTATALAYYLSCELTDKSISLIYPKDILSLYLFAPGIIYPQFDFKTKELAEYLSLSIQALEDLHVKSKIFDVANNPLFLVYKKEEGKMMIKKHKALLDQTNTDNCIFSREELDQTLPLLNSDLYPYVVSIKNAYLINSVKDLVLCYLKFAKENGVETKNYDKAEISIDYSSKTVKIGEETMHATEFLCITDFSLAPLDLELKRKDVLMLKTPIVEKFPRLSIVDFINNMILFVELEGYLSIYQSFAYQNFNEEVMVQKIKKNFSELFQNLDSLFILDQAKMTDIAKPFLDYRNNIYLMFLPIDTEISISPYLAKEFTARINEGKTGKDVLFP
ncbi:MAG: hypothetical protein ACTSQE_03145 [Candidatus Heimdallarchaeaceae archaeon]